MPRAYYEYCCGANMHAFLREVKNMKILKKKKQEYLFGWLLFRLVEKKFSELKKHTKKRKKRWEIDNNWLLSLRLLSFDYYLVCVMSNVIIYFFCTTLFFKTCENGGSSTSRYDFAKRWRRRCCYALEEVRRRNALPFDYVINAAFTWSAYVCSSSVCDCSFFKSVFIFFINMITVCYYHQNVGFLKNLFHVFPLLSITK